MKHPRGVEVGSILAVLEASRRRRLIADEAFRATLADLSGVHVEVEPINADAEQDGLASADVRADVESVLRGAGMGVHTPTRLFADVPGTPVLHVDVMTVRLDERYGDQLARRVGSAAIRWAGRRADPLTRTAEPAVASSARRLSPAAAASARDANATHSLAQLLSTSRPPTSSQISQYQRQGSTSSFTSRTRPASCFTDSSLTSLAEFADSQGASAVPLRDWQGRCSVVSLEVLMKKTEFLAQVQAAGQLSSAKEAERWSKAVLTALSDLAPDSETRRQFITQLPGFLKTPLRDTAPRAMLMDHEALVQRIGAELGTHASEAERALTGVWSVLRKAISAGEIADFQARVPKDVASYLAGVA